MAEGILPNLTRAVRDYATGSTTKGRCADCKHGSSAVPGCGCPAAWCPCHKQSYGHGAHGCNCK